MPCSRSAASPSTSSAKSRSSPCVPCFFEVLLERSDEIVGGEAGVVEHSADQRRLAVVDGAAGDEPQQGPFGRGSFVRRHWRRSQGSAVHRTFPLAARDCNTWLRLGEFSVRRHAPEPRRNTPCSSRCRPHSFFTSLSHHQRPARSCSDRRRRACRARSRSTNSLSHANR